MSIVKIYVLAIAKIYKMPRIRSGDPAARKRVDEMVQTNYSYVSGTT
jgi:hypothetical protein